MIKKFLHWLRSSLEGADGKSSSKNLTAFLIAFLTTTLHILFGYIALRIVEKEIPTEASLEVMDRIRDLILIDWTILLVLFGVVTIQSLIQMYRTFKGHSESQPMEVTTTTETKIKTKDNEEITTTDSNRPTDI